MSSSAATTAIADKDAEDKSDISDHGSSDTVAPVTIIMSNYNQAQYLHESLSGLVNQALPAQTILVIDDGSTDNSVDIIRDFERGHTNLRLIRNKVNLGLQDSIERVLPLIETEYLVWAASDDILLPTFLELSMAELRKHPEAGLCFSELTVLKDDTGEVSPFGAEPSVAHIFNLSDLTSYMPPEAVLARMKRSYFPVSGNTVVVRRDSLEACGNFFKDLQWHSDHFAFNVIAMRYGACVVPNTLGLIRQRSDSYSASGMHDINIQRPVLNTMLDILERDDFEDIRHAFARAPSYYNVWGTTILRLMLKRSVFWPTAFNFSLWKFQEYCWGHNLTKAQALRRLSARVLKRFLSKGPEMNIFGRKKIRELTAEVESLKVERDGLDADRTRLRQTAEEAAAQREEVRALNTHLTRDMEELRSQMEGVNANVAYLTDMTAQQKSEITKQKSEITKQKSAIAKQTKAFNALEQDVAKQAKVISQQNADIAAQEEIVANQTDVIAEHERVITTQKADLATNEKRIESLEVDLDQARANAAERENALNEAAQANTELREETAQLSGRLSNLTLHDTPSAPTSFADDTHLYGKDEPRPAETVLITTMPKAGTYYLSRLFSEGIGLRPLIVSNQYFPEDTIYQPRLREFFRGGYVSQDHFPASPINIAHLCHVTEKVVVHVRDPRQATLSYIHFLDDDMFQKNLEETRKLIYPTLPEGFFDLDISQRLDWGIDHWLPELVSWVQRWQDADRESTLQIKFTRFEDLVADSAAFSNEILEFLGIPPERFVAPDVKLNSEVHFRKGETDEWRGVFSQQQLDRANGYLPSDLSERFSWQP